MTRRVTTYDAASGGSGGGGGSSGVTAACVCEIIAGYAGTFGNCMSNNRAMWEVVCACACWTCCYGTDWVEWILPTHIYCRFCIIMNGLNMPCYCSYQLCWALGTNCCFTCCTYTLCYRYGCYFNKYCTQWSNNYYSYCNCYMTMDYCCNNGAQGTYSGFCLLLCRTPAAGANTCSDGASNGEQPDFHQPLRWQMQWGSPCRYCYDTNVGCECINWGFLSAYCTNPGLCWAYGCPDNNPVTSDDSCTAQFSRFRIKSGGYICPFTTNCQGCDIGSRPSWYIWGQRWVPGGATVTGLSTDPTWGYPASDTSSCPVTPGYNNQTPCC